MSGFSTFLAFPSLRTTLVSEREVWYDEMYSHDKYEYKI